ncbi:sensor domain-containing diguanylate cyclase [uncultured Thiodictyon sp.]|uniref:sensor domain-containing diguanylate cyclase n=1 Tax=uncultured Thiodictyon sp. TaxID=1846217 RepID=UPI0025FFFE7E|nr:sensor domain-containing diguanylate cyclase [uncultured Thiodictyon sp.]
MKKHVSYWIATLFALAIVTGVGTYVRHVKLLRAEIESTFLSRNELLSTFVALHRDQVTVMRNLVVERYRTAAEPAVSGLQIREHPELNGWEVLTPEVPVAGTVTGDGPLPLSPQQRREIAAAMGIEAQVRAALKFDKEVAWLYYVSANQFIYLAPQTPVEQFHFTPELYQRGYWLEAVPERNPQRRMILNGPLKDLGGKGWVMTFAEPVYVDNTFLGVVALDLRIQTLEQLTKIGQSTGETIMIGENERLIARPGGFAPDVQLQPRLSDKLIDWHEDDANGWWLSSPVIKDELWLVHRVSRRQLYWAAARESAATWLVIVMLGVLGVMAWRLRTALAQVTQLTHVDPLTQALNRRGFYAQAQTTLALAKRKQLPLALIIMDIDHFKRINDNHGHAAGDTVLKQLGGYLNDARRPFDLFCRWGGEEFILVLVLDDATPAVAVAERFRQEAQRTRIPPDDLPITLSGGLVMIQDGEPIDAAIKRADRLLYQAKEGGRNKIIAQV